MPCIRTANHRFSEGVHSSSREAEASKEEFDEAFPPCANVEGASGVGRDAMLSGNEFHRVREMITGDINACVRGIRRFEPDAAIDLFDAHGLGGNVLEERLEQGMRLLGGGWVDILIPLVSAPRNSMDLARLADAAVCDARNS